MDTNGQTLLNELGGELTCAICQEFYREPVSLICQHKFCRQCVRDLANHLPTDVLYQLKCPVCRKTIPLGFGGVGDLTTDYKLAEIMGIFQKYISSALPDNAGYLCGLHHRICFVYCTTCQAPICKECFRDRNHDQHKMNHIELESDFQKELLEAKGRDLEEIKKKLVGFMTDCQDISNTAKGKTENKKREYRKAYDKALQELSTWLKNAEASVDQEFREWRNACERTIRDLQRNVQQIDKLLKTSQEVLSKTATMFLQEANQLGQRITSFVLGVEDSVKKQDETIRSLAESLDIDRVTPKYVTVKEVLAKEELELRTDPKQLMVLDCNSEEAGRDTQTSLKDVNTTPPRQLVWTGTDSDVIRDERLLFKRISGDRLQIRHNGSLLKCYRLQPYQPYQGWTNGSFQSGEVTWILLVTFKPPSITRNSACACVCAAGVVQNHCGLGVHPGKTSWYAGLEYSQGSCKCYSHGDRSVVQHQYHRGIPSSGSISLKFHLDCNRRTLKVFDHIEKKLMCVIEGVDISQPLTPAVRFWSTENAPVYMSAQLVH